MGPVTGMTPDKRADTPGTEKVAGLCQIDRMGSLPEAVDAAGPKATLVGSDSADDELTNLNWLHESTNLLTNFSLGSEGPLCDIEGDDVSTLGQPCHKSPEKKSATSKPPYSFSLLIYMAIEHSPNKCLPVKEIYSWILDRFPYFATAPTGWKNSVRHNLSLNKCFQKVERSHGKVNGKGSLWRVDPEYKPNLMQALKKQPFSPPPSDSPSPHYFSSALKQDQVRALKESDIDAATAMILLNTSIEQGILECAGEKPEVPAKRSRARGAPGAVDPKADHNYSACGLASASAGSDGSEGFHSEDEDEDEDTDVDDPRRDPARKQLRRPPRPEIDAELQEAAGSLLRLAGVRTCLGSLLGQQRRK